ncbi:hypothetical protein ABEB36_005094 [Hypothenemus hampei]|uniref:Uncharacterized protein n=1 Tax=Hypothenemus hampei TaxID=57062 RepID=A0ABD1EZZ1_HYPHA
MKKIKDNMQKQKTGRRVVNWEYYDRFCEIFAEDKTINTPMLISSSTINNEIKNGIKPETTNLLLQNSFSGSSSRPNEALRKRQLEMENQRLDELKKIRLQLNECNEINKQKLETFQRYVEYITLKTDK